MAAIGSAALRRWSRVHTVSSLVCTLALLLACVTGLPLVFADEIDDWLHPAAAQAAAGEPAGIDAILGDALARRPGWWPEYVVREGEGAGEAAVVVVGLKTSLQAPGRIDRLRYDAATGALIDQIAARPQGAAAWMQLMRGLHTDLFAGLPGGILMGGMALVFLAAMVSGWVLYGPFMNGRRFGSVRRGRSARIVWLDLHNLLGYLLLAWALLIGVTGAFNQLAKPLFARWTATEVRPLALRLRGGHPAGVPQPRDWTSLQAAIQTAEQALPGARIGTMLMPGSRYGSPHHYLLWAAGDSPLTSRLLQPVLVDARSGTLSAIARMPWYLRVLELSRPLHFGDYGGLPLKLLWLVLDLATIVVLASGLWLWLDRWRRATAGMAASNRA